MKIVEYTDQELAANREMINIALKAIGMPAAAVALALDRKLAGAIEKPEPTSQTNNYEEGS